MNEAASREDLGEGEGGMRLGAGENLGSGAMLEVYDFQPTLIPKGFLLGICFRARRTGYGQNADGRRGVRGADHN